MHPPVTPSTYGSVTTSDMDLYVATTGSDATGDGSILNPYATIDRAYEDVPYTVNHAVHFHIGAGLYGVGSWPYKVSNSFGDSGFLSFDASLAMTEVVASKTIDAGGWNSLLGFVSADITVVGGGMVVDAYKGMFIEYLTGTAAGYIAPIIGNSATAIRIGPYDAIPADGDTFRIIYPGAEIELDNGMYSVIGDGGSPSFFFPFGVFGSPDVFLIGLRFHTTGFASFNINNIYSISCVGTIFDVFCHMSNSEIITATLTFGTPSKYIDVTDWASIWDGGCIFNYEVKYIGDCYAYCITVTGAELDCSGEVYYSCILKSTFYALVVRGSGLSFSYLYLDGGGAAAAYIAEASGVGFDGVYVNAGSSGLSIREGCSGIVVEGLEGDNAAVTNALNVSNGCNVAINTGSCTLVGSGGAGNAIKWESGAANSAYPAADNFVTDALGAQVVGY